VISDTFEASRWPDLTVLGPFTRDLKALALPLGQRERRDAINAWLAAREADGWLPDQRRRLGVQGAETGPAGLCAESLGSAIELRFSLMPLVAAVKRREGLPVSDPAQEAAVLGRAEAMAAREDLSAEAAAGLFRWLIDAAKRIQRQSHVTADSHLTLAGLRAAVAGTSDMLLPEIKRCRGALAGHAEILDEVLRNRLGDWLEPAQLDALRDRLPPRRDYARKP
jgi:chorismate mutase